MTRILDAGDLSSFLGLPGFDGVELSTADFLLELTENLVREELGQTLTVVIDDGATIDTDGGEVLLLPELPVISVTAVRVDPNGVNELALTVDTDYRVELGHKGRRGLLRRASHWPVHGRVYVEYTHGFRTGLEDPPLVPGDFPYEFPASARSVMLQAAARGFTNPSQLGQEQSGRWLGTYREVGLYLTAADKVALDPLRRGAG